PTRRQSVQSGASTRTGASQDSSDSTGHSTSRIQTGSESAFRASSRSGPAAPSRDTRPWLPGAAGGLCTSKRSSESRAAGSSASTTVAYSGVSDDSNERARIGNDHASSASGSDPPREAVALSSSPDPERAKNPSSSAASTAGI